MMTEERNSPKQKIFSDRADAGKKLALRLDKFGIQDPIVMALPKGGVPVAYEVAKQLKAPLEALIAVKLHSPKGQHIGAVSEGGGLALDHEMIRALGLGHDELLHCIDEDQRQLERRRGYFRPDHHLPDLQGRQVILVDDFIDNGWSIMAALARIRAENPARIVLAVPVAPAPLLNDLAPQVSDLISLCAPAHFGHADDWYQDCSKVDGEVVLKMLEWKMP